jgi:uncharacterized membrane protein YdbT with pleckstrin-like domain
MTESLSLDDVPSGDVTVRISKWRFLYFIFCFFGWRKRTWTASDTVIVARTGIFARNETRIPWGRVTDKSISQSLFGRMCNFGTIRLETAGDHAGSQMVMEKVANAEIFYKIVCARCEAATPR